MSEIAAAESAPLKRKESESETPSEKKRCSSAAALPDQTRPPKSDILVIDLHMHAARWWMPMMMM
jgi:hypothetical protein